MAVPFTFTINPSPAQVGRRTASVNACAFEAVIEILAVSPSGNSVSIASDTSRDARRAVLGAYRFTQTVSGDS